MIVIDASLVLKLFLNERIAWRLAQRLNRPTVYDCCYLALAEMAGCDLWTADRRLLNAVSASLPWVRSTQSFHEELHGKGGWPRVKT